MNADRGIAPSGSAAPREQAQPASLASGSASVVGASVGAAGEGDAALAPAIRDRVILEARPIVPVELDATIANLTPDEVWVGVDPGSAGHLRSIQELTISLVRPDRHAVSARTRLRRFVGASGRVVALWRPTSWVHDARRAHGRLDLRLPAYLRPDPDRPGMVPAWTTNVSVGGFQCIAPISLPPGARIEVELALSPLVSLTCLAMVVRPEPYPGNPSARYLLACRFVDLSETQQAQIAAALGAMPPIE